ncbi:YidC/Oxa1 family membrane protein insertase [Methylomagnum ishizawai]|uniref:Membrane protein insertase YidC n=1 Tax=Methylomagnum ishizawai TaxID=1760988 RepID=A0A1Y6CYS2_9GAMM|nr:membrane protein insertase YidC [Methylomagnum ishizawai]SMF93713.1 YidC/Oxa1 family membrane protein insertase [Methylomagnum ishizawai]
MDNLRFVLFALLFFLGFTIWQQWQVDYGPRPDLAALQQQQQSPAAPDVPDSARGVDDIVKQGEPAASAAPHRRVVVTSDLFRLEIDTQGGDIRKLDLLNYPISKDHPDQPVELFSDGDLMFVAQSGFLGNEASAPTHHSVWEAQADQYQMAPGQDTLRVPLAWTNDQGVKVVKTYVLKRGSYEIALEQEVTNGGAAGWKGRQYVQLQRKDPGNKDQLVRTYTGGVLYTPEEKYRKISFKDMTNENLDKKSKDGWIAMIQHYFVAAWIPAKDDEETYYTKALSDNHFVIGAYSPALEVAPGQSKVFTAQLYAGPKLLRVLEATAPGLDLTVDYGALTFIAKPVFWLLEQFHKIFDNWGWAIIFVTLTLKALFFRLSASSYRSMANMRKLQPKLAELKEKYGSDKQKLNMAMMEMYRKEKVNPLGGCLPILVQIPVFISLYWVLVESVEMRQAPFMLWLNDLSDKDPYFVLPLIMGVSMFIQQKLSPPPSDPVQAKVMLYMPVMFTGFFAFFPSGLVVYWVVNNLLSIVQQWYINKTIIVDKPAPAGS